MVSSFKNIPAMTRKKLDMSNLKKCYARSLAGCVIILQIHRIFVLFLRFSGDVNISKHR